MNGGPRGGLEIIADIAPLLDQNPDSKFLIASNLRYNLAVMKILEKKGRGAVNKDYIVSIVVGD
jgi:hypothetical protein